MAYDVLSDPQERTIGRKFGQGRGASKEMLIEDGLDVFQRYFSFSSCYSGFVDNDMGVVYRVVFNTLVAEDAESDDDDKTFVHWSV